MMKDEQKNPIEQTLTKISLVLVSLLIVFQLAGGMILHTFMQMMGVL